MPRCAWTVHDAKRGPGLCAAVLAAAAAATAAGVGAAGAAGAVLLGGVGWVTPAAAAALGTLMIGKPSEPDTLDPAVAQSNNSLTVTCKTYETLVKFAVVNGRATADVMPGLAQSWTVDASGQVWDFKLAPGHRFSDGRAVDAAAVKFSFDRLLELAKGPNEDYPAVGAVDVRDAMTVRFELKYPFAPFLPSLAACAGEIVAPAVMAFAVNGDFAQGYLATHSLGSGPYQIASVEKGEEIVLEPNPYFPGPPPRLQRVVIKIIKEAAVRRLELEKGDLDLIEEVSPDQVDVLRKKPGIVVIDEPCFREDILFLNAQRPPFDNATVRQALSYAIDYQGIIDGVLLGYGKQMRGFIPDGFAGYDPSAPQFHYDPKKARQLLVQSGFTHLQLGFLYAKADPTWETVGLVVQQNLADIGVKLDLHEYSYTTMRDMIDRGDFDIAIGNYAPDFNDPSQYLNYWVDSRLFGLSGNRAFYKNMEVDTLIRSALSSSDAVARLALYHRAQRIAVEAAPYILMSQKHYEVAMRSNVHGYVFNPLLLQVFDFEDMWKSAALH